MRKKMLSLAGLLLAATGVYAQTEVTVGVMRGKDYGVTYMLPKTTIELTIRATLHTYTPGELCKYAGRYLRMNNVSIDPLAYWTLDEVEATAIGTPDKTNTYFVKLKDKTSAPLMELTEDGIVRSINMPYRGAATPVLTQVPETPGTSIDPSVYLTEEILMANSVAKMAELVAKEIYNIRDSKNALLRGEAEFMPKDGAQLQIMLDNLELQEKTLTEMFTGKNTETSQTLTIRIEPKEMKDEVAFRFSKTLGVVESDNLAGEPVYISLTDLKTVNIPMKAENESEKKIEGIAYNVPGRARITLSYNHQPLFDGELPVTQFGTTEYLAPVLFNKNSTTQVLFDTQTGGLLKVDRSVQ